MTAAQTVGLVILAAMAAPVALLAWEYRHAPTVDEWADLTATVDTARADFDPPTIPADILAAAHRMPCEEAAAYIGGWVLAVEAEAYLKEMAK